MYDADQMDKSQTQESQQNQISLTRTQLVETILEANYRTSHALAEDDWRELLTMTSHGVAVCLDVCRELFDKEDKPC
ncbi:MAG: hypothetical protein VB099_16475 [Candidatus Limiplasma sp.]|nr:hypothetical protein [Candidatus Limiplasma sp.]